MTAHLQSDIVVAFRAVFGTNDNERSKEQLIVLAKLRQLAQAGRVPFSPVEDERSNCFRQGRLDMWLEIERRITEAQPDSLKKLLGLSAESEET